MSYPEEEYRRILYSFRLCDLQSLLGTFNLGNTGRKNELQNRAFDFLRNKSAVNYQAFIAKIIEIYNLNKAHGGSNNMQNKWQKFTPAGMQQAHPSTLYQQSSQNPQQSTNIPQAGPSQVMPKILKAISGSNKIQQTYGRGGPCIKMPQVPLNQQVNAAATNHLTDNTNANSFIPSTQSLAKIKLKKLPFYEVISEIIKPMTLIGKTKCSLPSGSKGMKEEVFKFILSPQQATDIGMNRDISNGKNYYLYQLQIRICLFEPDSIEINDFLPIGLHIRVSNLLCPLPPSTKHGAVSRPAAQPIDCTKFVKLSPCVENTINVNWIPDAKTYIMGVYLVKKLTPEYLLQQLLNKRPRSSEETKNYIIKKLADVDPDFTTTSYRFSLVCPLGKIRMKIPAKSIGCKHLQCFDASTFILMNEKKSTWTCPTCNQPCLYDDIHIESYFLKVVMSPNLPDSCKEIEILADGTWKVYKENNDPVETATDDKEKPQDCIYLDSDDENIVEVKKDNINYPESSKESEKLKTGLIDLTLSDDEEPIKEKDEEEKAQASDSLQPVIEVNEKPSILVQPQLVVTSSEPGIIIEIDSSPSPPSSPTPTTIAS